MTHPEMNPLPVDRSSVLRALGNPTRIALYNHLYVSGGGTATTCGRATNLSASAASYHLRLMARHGIIASFTGGDDGRETWWKLTTEGFRLVVPHDDEDGKLIFKLRSSLLDAAVERIRFYFLRQRDFSNKWQLEAGVDYYTHTLTPAEVRDLRARLEQVVRDAVSHSTASATDDTYPVNITLGVTPVPPPASS